ncbi:MAG: DUF4186 domain-containing protein [Candidatus Omnitrophota bacterium]|nr:MAG: DUF4186 domain-containing protein [Candidatus Omnitrophota bacterium]
MPMAVDKILKRLAKSRFRSSFKLNDKDIEYINKKGLGEIKSHAREFIIERLAPKNPKNDGRQTPLRKHPVFKAQHATATCCRGCLKEWHKIPSGRKLNGDNIDFIVSLIMSWISAQADAKDKVS